VFCTTEEGIKGRRAVEWRLVDEILPRSRVEEKVAARVQDFLARSTRPQGLTGIALTPLRREIAADRIRYSAVEVEIDRDTRVTTVTVHGPETPPPADADALAAEGAETWMLRAARELDDAVLHLRINERETAVLQFKTLGAPARVLEHDRFIDENHGHWLAREIRHLWKRVLKRVDLTSRTLVAVIEPGSCFAGTLAELAFAADRSYMLIGQFEGDNRAPATLTLGPASFGPYPMSNGLTRLKTRFLGTPEAVETARTAAGRALDAAAAEELGLVTFALDDIDWEDEVRVFLEERASFSPDALTGMEANLRFGGPETMESKIFARLTAWQNWIFQRPNAVGPEGALRRYGTGQKAAFDMGRV
jgi:benzoyl-CoA-dihydrodiol lyase